MFEKTRNPRVGGDYCPIMFDFSQLFSSPAQMWTLFLCAVLVGMSKTGMQGINTISIPLMAIAFGAKPSTGVILPMLCFADLVAVCYYRRQIFPCDIR